MQYCLIRNLATSATILRRLAGVEKGSEVEDKEAVLRFKPAASLEADLDPTAGPGAFALISQINVIFEHY